MVFPLFRNSRFWRLFKVAQSLFYKHCFNAIVFYYAHFERRNFAWSSSSFRITFFKFWECFQIVLCLFYIVTKFQPTIICMWKWERNWEKEFCYHLFYFFVQSSCCKLFQTFKFYNFLWPQNFNHFSVIYYSLCHGVIQFLSIPNTMTNETYSSW